MHPSRAYSWFIRSFLGVFFLFPVLLGTFNYQVDPNNRYRFKVSAEQLKELSGANDRLLAVPANYDDRSLLKKYASVAGSPELLILGGSRVANLHPWMFKQPYAQSSFNASVTNGSIRDYVALWQMAKSEGFRPKLVVIGLEQQSLNPASQNDRYLSLLEHYEAFFQSGFSLRVRLMGLTTDLKDLLSLQTTVASVRLLCAKEPERGEIVTWDKYKTGRRGAKTRSFSLLYPSGYEDKTTEWVRTAANANGRGEQKALARWNRSNLWGFDQLSKLIRDIHRSGSQVLVVGMPYHPEALRLIMEDAKAADNLLFFKAQLKHAVSGEGALFYDGLVDNAMDVDEGDFSDGIHLKEHPNYDLFKKADSASGTGFMADSFTNEPAR